MLLKVTLGESLYVFGGAKGAPYNTNALNPNLGMIYRPDALDSALRINPLQDFTWTDLPNMPMKRKAPTCGVVKVFRTLAIIKNIPQV